MFQIKNISIPQPCSQSWQQMEQKEQGRHCTSCSKIVIDFTRMTNTEILDYLAGAKNVCGRFNEHQLFDINHKLASKKETGAVNWKRWLVAAGILGAGFLNKADAQAATAITAVRQQPVSKSYLLGKIPPRRKTPKHPYKKARQVTVETGHIKNNQVDLLARRADISDSAEKFNQLPEPAIFATDVNASIELNGMVGGVSVSGVEINVQSRVEMFYQYMPWPINNLSNLFR